MMKKRQINQLIIYANLMLLLTAIKLSTAQSCSFDLMTGLVSNLRSPLMIQEQGKDNLVFSAEYSTKSFEQTPYFLVRFNFPVATRMLEIQFIHHKILLSNTQNNVSHFEMSNGFNILSINYRLSLRLFNLRFGFGAVFTYPESVISGRLFAGQGGLFNSGYYLAGPALLAGINRTFPLSKKIYLNGEVQLTAGWALIPIATGQAYVSNFALHFLIGGGYSF